MTTRTFRFSVVAQAAPSWTLGLATKAIGEWAQISPLSGVGSTIASVKPGQKPGDNFTLAERNGLRFSVATPYSGGVLAMGYGQNGSLLVWGGGHGDYFGNEVYAFDLHTATWDRISDPFVGNESTFPGVYTTQWQTNGTAANGVLRTGYLGNSGMYPPQAKRNPANADQVNGSPGVPHTFDGLWYSPVTNSMYSPFSQHTMDTSPPGKAFCLHKFSLSTKQWSVVLANDSLAYCGSGTSAVYIPSTDQAYVQSSEDPAGGAYRFIRFDNVSTTPTRTLYTKTNQMYGMAYSPAHGVVGFSSPGTNQVVLRSVSVDTSASTTELIPQQALTSPNAASRAGFEWSPGLQAFVFCPDAGDTLTMAKQTGGVWAWSQLPMSGTSGVGSGAAGLHGRFQIVTYGSTDYAIVVRESTQPVYAARLN